jgi:hypothetical protein
VAIAENLPRMEGNQMSTIFTQRPGAKQRAAAAAPAPPPPEAAAEVK